MELTEPQRLQRSRKKGAKIASPNGLPVVYVGRGSQWGNPFVVGVHGTASECVEKYRHWLDRNRDSMKLDFLRGKNLACWCRIGNPCHADILLSEANS